MTETPAGSVLDGRMARLIYLGNAIVEKLNRMETDMDTFKFNPVMQSTIQGNDQQSDDSTSSQSSSELQGPTKGKPLSSRQIVDGNHGISSKSNLSKPNVPRPPIIRRPSSQPPAAGSLDNFHGHGNSRELNPLIGKRVPTRIIRYNRSPAQMVGSQNRQPNQQVQALLVGPLPPPPPPPPAPVIDTETGAIVKPSLCSFINELKNLVPPLIYLNNAQWQPSDKQAALRAQFIQHLDRIKDLTTRSDVSEEELGLRVRDQFAAAADVAANLSKTFNHYFSHKAPDERYLAHQYSDISRIMGELKRLHLTHAAPGALNGYAKREAENMSRSIATLEKAVPGNTLSHNKMAGVSYGLPGVVEVGLSGGKAETLFRDDDNDLDWWRSNTVAANATFGVNGGSQLAANVTASATATFGGVYFEHGSLAGDKGGMLNLTVNDQANNARLKGKSAGPNARSRIKKMDQFSNNVQKFILGREYTALPGAPRFVHDAKLAKGYNPTKMHDVLVPQLDGRRDFARDWRDPKNRQWKILFDAYYPSATDTIDLAIKMHGPLPQNPISQTIPLSEAYGAGPLSVTAGVQGSFGINSVPSAVHGTDDVLGAGAGFSAGGNYTYMKFDMRTATFGHQMLDPRFHKDMKQNYSLYAQLDAASAGDDVPEELRRYALMRERLRPDKSLTRDNLGGNFLEADSNYYGASTSIPTQFVGDLIRPSCERVAKVEEEINQLSAEYRNFLKNANRVLAQPDKFLSYQESKTLTTLRRRAAQAICRDVFAHNRDHRSSIDEVLRDPESFVARANESYSLALGCAGTHLSTLKRELLTKKTATMNAGLVRNTHAAIQKADSAYNDVRELIDNAYLPIKKEKLTEQATFKNKTKWARHDVVVANLGASGGVSFNPLSWFKQNKSETVSVANSDGQVAFNADIRWQNATMQPNSARLGHFWRITLTSSGGEPLVGKLMTELFDKIAAKACPGSGMEIERYRTDLKEELRRQVQGAAISETGGQVLQIKLHQLPGGKKYQTQYVRGATNRGSSVGVSVPIPTPVGVFTPSASASQSAQSVKFERMGPDLGYVMMQHPRLVAAVTEKGGAWKTGALKAVFVDEPDLQTKYFNNPDTIVTLLDQFHTYQQAAARAAREENWVWEGDITHNPFYRYFETAEFKRASELANTVVGYAPGSMADGIPPTRPLPLSALKTRVKLDNWDATKEHIATLDSEMARRDYFCDGGPSGGATVFRQFMDIIAITKQINGAVMFHADKTEHGFYPELKHELQTPT